MANKIIIAWDSVTLIDAIEKNAFWPEIEPVYKDAKIGKVVILISEITVAEVCKLRGAKAGACTAEEAAEMVTDFLDNEFIKVKDVTRRETSVAAELIRKHHLETCDAIIAATASIHDAQLLYRRDGVKKRRASQASLLKCDGLIGHPPLPIKTPNAADYLKLPLWQKQHETEQPWRPDDGT